MAGSHALIPRRSSCLMSPATATGVWPGSFYSSARTSPLQDALPCKRHLARVRRARLPLFTSIPKEHGNLSSVQPLFFHERPEARTASNARAKQAAGATRQTTFPTLSALSATTLASTNTGAPPCIGLRRFNSCRTHGPQLVCFLRPTNKRREFHRRASLIFQNTKGLHF